ncbi:MAG: Mrp/NBP35 family ATP-binding protein [Actinomycetaceae bacterium]|nr:Mrp/NBP35 family ATP-binding protein [Actinomycetaceae bacterium]
MVTADEVRAALESVIDPEIHRPITDLNMVEDVVVDGETVSVSILLTTAGCPLRDNIQADVAKTVGALEGVERVNVRMGAMNHEQRAALQTKLRGGKPERVVPFSKPGNLTRVYAVASGKGGVGKSSVTANLAAAMSAQGLKVGLVDADIFGFSIPRMMGVTTAPTPLNEMIIPPVAHGVKTISIGMFLPDNSPVVWRGPMLHRALEQFFADVFWGDLDVLLLDLPPGTGDIAISVAQLVPKSEIVVVTTPQTAASEVAERAGQMSKQTGQRVVGVIENMSHLVMPDGSHNALFGSGGGQFVADKLSEDLGYEVPLLASIPIEVALREGGDAGVPLVLSEGDSPAQSQLRTVADRLSHRSRGLVGLGLGVTPV